MANERSDPRSAHLSFSPLMLRTRDEAIAELSKPCDRFRSQFSGEEKMRSFIAHRINEIDVVPGPSLLAYYGMPLNWQQLLDYLYEQNVITAPRFTPRTFANDRPKLFNFQLDLNRNARRTQGREGDTAGFGAAFSREIAMTKTIGETLERYFLSIYERESMLHRTPNELLKRGKNVLDIEQLNGFLPWQKSMFPQFARDKDAPLSWVKGEEFPSGRTTLLPAQLVFWNYLHQSADARTKEGVLAHPTTSGCAGHFTKDEAVLAGLLENIQRDGFLIYWLNALSPNVLDVSESTDPDVLELLQYLDRYGLQATFLNTTTDVGIPSAICVLIDTATGEPIISVGGGAGFDLKSILIQSAIEALIVNNFTAKREIFAIPDEYRPFSDPLIGREQRLAAWKGNKMAKRFAFFTSGKKQRLKDFVGETGDILKAEEQLDYVLRRFREMGAGYEVYVYEANDPVLKNLGYHVVRTIVPQLFPLYLSEHTAPLDSKRLREVPGKLGFTAAVEPNPWPHPFP